MCQARCEAYGSCQGKHSRFCPEGVPGYQERSPKTRNNDPVKKNQVLWAYGEGEPELFDLGLVGLDVQKPRMRLLDRSRDPEVLGAGWC